MINELVSRHTYTARMVVGRLLEWSTKMVATVATGVPIVTIDEMMESHTDALDGCPRSRLCAQLNVSFTSHWPPFASSPARALVHTPRSAPAANHLLRSPDHGWRQLSALAPFTVLYLVVYRFTHVNPIHAPDLDSVVLEIISDEQALLAAGS
jgi:hypothetical protein